jgi:cytoskeleton protein RodZ
MDPAPVLVLLPAHEARTLEQVGEGINTPFRKPGDLVSAAEAWRRMRPTAYVVFALLLASVLIYVFPAAWLKLPIPPAKTAPASLPLAGTQTEVLEPVLPHAAASQAQPEAPTPVAASPEAVVSQPVSIPTPAAPGEQGTNVVMSFHAAADSWVEVQDRDRQVVLKKLIKAGETQLAQGKPPLNVSIGNAEKTTVQVRGKPFDLAPATRENVARFTVQ